MRSRTRRDVLLVGRIGVVVAAANVALAVLGRSVFAVPVGLSAAACAVLVARRGGVTWDELGLAAAQLRRGVLFGVGAIGVVAAVGVVVLAVPIARQALAAIPPAAGGTADLAFELGVRVLLGVALTEELLFRSALLAGLDRWRSTVAAVSWSAVAFGAWHVLPALTSGGGGAFGALDDIIGPVGASAAVIVVTTLAGVILARVRLAGGHVVGAVLAHAAVNATAAGAVWLMTTSA